MESAKYTLNFDDVVKVAKGVFYAAATAGLTYLGTYVSELEVDPEFMFILPIVNGLIVLAKRYLSGK